MSKITYSVIARNSLFDDVTADCGHNHKTIDAAVACRDRLFGNNPDSYPAKWHNAKIERNDGTPLTDDESYEVEVAAIRKRGW